jgi:hypothetical protein
MVLFFTVFHLKKFAKLLINLKIIKIIIIKNKKKNIRGGRPPHYWQPPPWLGWTNHPRLALGVVRPPPKGQKTKNKIGFEFWGVVQPGVVSTTPYGRSEEFLDRKLD